MERAAAAAAVQPGCLLLSSATNRCFNALYKSITITLRLHGLALAAERHVFVGLLSRTSHARAETRLRFVRATRACGPSLDCC